MTSNPTESPLADSSCTRRGKIARLPLALRDELNRRLEDGEPGSNLVAWLNDLPAVQKILADEFHGVPLNDTNLSRWKQGGGFADWRRLQEARALALSFAEEFSTLEEAAGDASLTDVLTAPLALGRWLRAVTVTLAALPPETLAREGLSLLPLAREIANLRRLEQREHHVRLERERWDTQLHALAAEKAQQARMDREWEAGRAEREALKARELPAFVASALTHFGQGSKAPS